MQVGLDGIRMLDPNTSRTLRIYPLETVTRWDVSKQALVPILAQNLYYSCSFLVICLTKSCTLFIQVLDSSVFAFWSKSSVDHEARRIRLKSSSYTTNTILDTVTAASVQVCICTISDTFCFILELVVQGCLYPLLWRQVGNQIFVSTVQGDGWKQHFEK